MDCDTKPSHTILAVNQSPGNFFIFWNVIVPLSVLPSMLHYGPRKYEMFLLMSLLLNPYLMEYISRNHLLSWIAVIFLVIVVYNFWNRWPWYNIYSERFVFKLLILAIFLAIPDMIISYTWPSLCKGLYNIIHNADKSLKRAQIDGYRNSMLLIGASMFLLHSMYFYRMYNACSCRFWTECPRTKCPRPKPDKCPVYHCSLSWKCLRNGLLKTINGCGN